MSLFVKLGGCHATVPRLTKLSFSSRRYVGALHGFTCLACWTLFDKILCKDCVE